MSEHHESLGIEKISKLLYKQSVPATIGLLVISLYNFVDAIFIGHGVGTLGVAALGVAFPIQMIMMSIPQTMGVGAASIISRKLGAKQYEEAEITLGNFFSITAIFSVSATVLGYYFLGPLLKIFGASETILPYAQEYMSIIFIGTILISLTAGCNNIIRAEGRARYSMIVMISSIVMNIILAPIFIFYFKMGMKGAAFATVAGQGIGAIMTIAFFLKGKSGIKIGLHHFKLKYKVIKEIIKMGSSLLVGTIAGSILIIFLNRSLGDHGGDLAIASYGIINRILAVIAMPIFGLVQGLQPILGYNHGAALYKRAHESIILTLKVMTLISIGAFIILFIFAESMAKLFTSDKDLILMTKDAIRIIIIFLPLSSFQKIASGLYRSIGKALPAYVFSSMQIILILPLILILPEFFGLHGIWFSFPITDFVAGVIIFFFVRKELRALKIL